MVGVEEADGILIQKDGLRLLKENPCLRRFARSFASSHSKHNSVIHTVYIRLVPVSTTRFRRMQFHGDYDVHGDYDGTHAPSYGILAVAFAKWGTIGSEQ